MVFCLAYEFSVFIYDDSIPLLVSAMTTLVY